MERFATWKRPKIEHNKLTQWNWMVQYPDKLELGEHTDIGAFSYINAKHGVKIGKNVHKHNSSRILELVKQANEKEV